MSSLFLDSEEIAPHKTKSCQCHDKHGGSFFFFLKTNTQTL